MTITLLSRHPGAIQWARQRLAELGFQGPQRVLTHLAEAEFGPGDVVCGVLPLGLAAKLCAQGVRVLAIDMALPEHLRGVELSAEQLEALQACLVEYRVSAWAVGEAPAAANLLLKGEARP
jgi:CRISPR-associated protein Csx16